MSGKYFKFVRLTILKIKMKKIIFYTIAAFLSVSCFKNITYTSMYHLLASFEYEQETVKWHADSTYYAGSEYLGLTWNDDLVFCHSVDDNNDFNGGFRLSCLEGLIRPEGELESDAELDKTWRVYAPKNNVKNAYSVFCFGSRIPKSHIRFLTSKYGTCTMSACYVTNTAKVADEVKRNFQRGDKLTLTAIGYLNSQETARTSIDMADYTLFDKNGEQKDSIISDWTKFDLSKLGTVDEVRFEMTSGMRSTSKYFCLDNLVCLINLEY